MNTNRPLNSRSQAYSRLAKVRNPLFEQNLSHLVTPIPLAMPLATLYRHRLDRDATLAFVWVMPVAYLLLLVFCIVFTIRRFQNATKSVRTGKLPAATRGVLFVWYLAMIAMVAETGVAGYLISLALFR